MARVVLDDLRAGLYLSANYIRTNYLAESASFGTLFELYHRVEKTAQDANVINAGPTDTSAVYQVKSKNAQRYMTSGEYSTNQTGTIILPAPGVGKRIIIEYGSIRSESVSGNAYFYDSVTNLQSFKIYLSVQSSFVTANLFLPLAENASFKLTTTQGAKALYYCLGYHIEVIK